MRLKRVITVRLRSTVPRSFRVVADGIRKDMLGSRVPDLANLTRGVHGGALMHGTGGLCAIAVFTGHRAGYTSSSSYPLVLFFD